MKPFTTVFIVLISAIVTISRSQSFLGIPDASAAYGFTTSSLRFDAHGQKQNSVSVFGLGYFDAASGTPPFRLSDQDGKLNDNFGYSVAISGNTAIVGSFNRDFPENDGEGAAFIFEYDGKKWQPPSAPLRATSGAKWNRFGFSVAISGTTAVVGAPRKDRGKGAAYVFVKGESGWKQQVELTNPTSHENDEFGASVAISGNTVIVGARQSRIGATGAAYVFEREGNTWKPGNQLSYPGGKSGDKFGYTVATDGKTIVVGAPERDVGMSPKQGSAFVYVENASGSWEFRQELTAYGDGTNDMFGTGLAVDDKILMIGAPGDTVAGVRSQGSTYAYVRRNNQWLLTQRLDVPDGAIEAQLGNSISIDGVVAVVSAHVETVNGKFRQGIARVYMRSRTGQWEPAESLSAPDGEANDHFAFSVGLSKNRIIAGAHFDDNRRGSAHIFDRNQLPLKSNKQ